MRCIRCGKPLSKDALSVKTAQGLFFFGPECAKKAGLVVDRPARIGKINVTPDSSQGDFFGKNENARSQDDSI